MGMDVSMTEERILLNVETERYPIAGSFKIARGAKTEAAVVCVTLRQGLAVGRGECVPYSRYGETIENVTAAIERVRGVVESDVTREKLAGLMKAGAARNAVDCALWDLEAKRSGVRVYERAHLPFTRPVSTAFTISLDTPEVMAEMTRKAADRPILKIKVGGASGDIERIRAVRASAPNAMLIADANEGWNESNLLEHLRACREAGFALIEQPLPVAEDEALRSIEHLVPLCADESVHDRAGLDRLVGLYEAINVKLDKTGGFTEALALTEAALARKFEIMIGCMVGTSLAMAPGLLLASRAKFIDLDGPLLLAKDREPGLHFEGSTIFPPPTQLWG